jgi:DNA-binding NtrC family response regulator
VRELRSAVERAALRLDIESDVAALSSEETMSFREAKERAVAAWERTFVTELVTRNGGNLSRAARAARMDRTYLRELLRRHGRGGDQDPQ